MKPIDLQIVAPGDIEKRSMELIAQELGEHSFTPEQLPIVMRCIHTVADFDYAQTLRFTPQGVEAGVNAIRQGCTIVTDTNMAAAGINKAVLGRFGCQVRCFMAEADVAQEAKVRGVTRATVSMERASQLEGAVIVAIGNAPTALVRLCQLMDAGEIRPALVIGAPVGFVNVVESKELLASCPGEHIIPMGRKGGSTIATAICNALLYLASGDERE